MRSAQAAPASNALSPLQNSRLHSLLCGLCALLAYYAFTPSLAKAQSLAWTQETVRSPVARSGSAIAFDAARGTTVMFGGSTLLPSGTYGTSETWEWNGTGARGWTQRPVQGPSP